jgi:hypothetical protein
MFVLRKWDYGSFPTKGPIKKVDEVRYEREQEVLEITNLPTFLILPKNIICIKTSVCPNITLVVTPFPYWNTPTYKIMFQAK